MTKEQIFRLSIDLLEQKKDKFVSVRFRGKDSDCVVKDIGLHPKAKLSLHCFVETEQILFYYIKII